MAISDAIFDSITNSEDKMIERINIRRKDACLYLRAYIMIRLLFFKEIVISDSSINLNRALRTLILEKEGNGKYDLQKLPPADFGKLIENGKIKLAARDIYKDKFFERLREAQDNKKRVNKPSEEYTKMIDKICKEENIYWWNADEISQMFTKKIRDNFKMEYSDEVNFFLRDLSNRLSDRKVLTYNEVKNEALKMHKKTSEAYKILYDMLRDSYDYNIPEYFKMDYLKRYSGFRASVQKHNLVINPPEQYDISWKYSFNVDALAMFPADSLDFVWNSGEGIRYSIKLSQYMEGLISFSQFLPTIQEYLEHIDRLLMYHYNVKRGNNKTNNIILRFKEHKNGLNFVALTVELVTIGYDIIDIIPEITSDPVTGVWRLVLTNIFPSIVKKGYEWSTALPAIEHAIIKLDK